MKNDMYGHAIWPLGETGYGVSVSFYREGNGPLRPDFTFFHVSDGFRQALFSVAAWGITGENRPQVHNVFDDRMAEVGALVENAEHEHLSTSVVHAHSDGYEPHEHNWQARDVRDWLVR